MDSEIIPKVFILRYEYSEEDEGILCVFNDYVPAKFMKARLEESAMKSNRYIKFYIDVYEVLNTFNENQVSIFEYLSLKI